MPYKMDNAMIDQVKQNATIGAVVRGILGEDATVINQSAIINMPGADAQAWHVDGAHVSTSKHLPCHVLNVFVPLVDMQLELGPTEFRPGRD
jgi:ectoine hydroxylase-related dioxygenase (phytanoyl-CoA dioxygenase family)